MPQEVAFYWGAGKIRSFWAGLGWIVITLGVYYWFWYYLVNDELKAIGISRGVPMLAESKPKRSVIAVVVGCLLIIPSMLSVYKYGQRIKRAQKTVGVDPALQINPIAAFLLIFPGTLLVIPPFIHFWYVTKHQNLAVAGAGALNPRNAAEAAGEFRADGAPGS